MRLKSLMVATALAVATAAAGVVEATAQERGGVMRYGVLAEPSSLDLHGSNSFSDIHHVSPHYSTLLTYDWDKYPEVTGDLAEKWEVSDDGLTFTFHLRKNVVFHDGTPLTSRDVKASFERMRNPPEGVLSVRRANFEDIASIETPDDHTVVFKLSKVNAAMLDHFAGPFNVIYSAKDLEKDKNFPKTNINGTGPFVFKEHVPGSRWVATRFDKYYKEGRPYLDGIEALQLSGAALVNAIIGGQIHAEFRFLAPAQVKQIKDAMGDKVQFLRRLLLTSWLVTLNSKFEPFQDQRVRHALNLAIDRYQGLDQLGTVTITYRGGPSGLTVPGTPFALPPEKLEQMVGYGKDIEANRKKARELLKAAGQENLKFTLKNRAIPQPYEPLALFLIDQWRRIGVEVTMANEPSTQYLNSRRSGQFEAIIDFSPNTTADPSGIFTKFLSADRTSTNYSGYQAPEIDALFDKQSSTLDRQERIKLVNELEMKVNDLGYVLMIAFSDRVIPMSSELQGYKIAPSHQLNIKFDDIWFKK